MRPRPGGRGRFAAPALAPALALVLALALALAALPGGPAGAVLPDEVLDDPVLEARARELSREIRCVVCQNESIDSSNADLARDLRLLVRERLVAGDSDAQVLDFLVARYGEFVLLRPRFKPTNYLLWFGPGAVLLLGGLAIALYFHRRQASGSPTAPGLTPDEQTRLARLLKDDERMD